MNVEELRKLLKENRVCFYTYWDKRKLIELAKINNVLPKEEPKKELKKKKKKPEEEDKPKYVNYERLKNIRHTPTKVILKDIETVYKAAQFIDKSPQTLRYWGKKKGVWNNKYRVILE